MANVYDWYVSDFTRQQSRNSQLLVGKFPSKSQLWYEDDTWSLKSIVRSINELLAGLAHAGDVSTSQLKTLYNAFVSTHPYPVIRLGEKPVSFYTMIG